MTTDVTASLSCLGPKDLTRALPVSNYSLPSREPWRRHASLIYQGKKKSHWLTMAPRSSVQLIDKRQDVMSRQIVWKGCKRVHWGMNQRLKMH